MDEKHACRLPIDVIFPYLKPLNPIPTRLQSKGGLKPPIRCLLCDLYGTLLISGSGDVGQDQLQPPPLERLSVLLKHYAISQSAEELLEALREAIKSEHIKAKERGIDYPEVQIETIWQQILPSKAREELVRFAIEFEMVFNPVWPMPHLPELLTSCRELDIPLGIISNAPVFYPPSFRVACGRTPESIGVQRRVDLFFISARHCQAVRPALSHGHRATESVRHRSPSDCLYRQRHAKRHSARTSAGVSDHTLCRRRKITSNT